MATDNFSRRPWLVASQNHFDQPGTIGNIAQWRLSDCGTSASMVQGNVDAVFAGGMVFDSGGFEIEG
jgi:hypothetical protein